MKPAWLRQDGTDWILLLRIQPRAGRSGVVGPHAGRLRLRIAAPPVDGAANRQLQRFLADWLDLPRTQVIIEQGEAGRDKRVRLAGVGVLPAALRHLSEAATPAGD